MTVKDNVLKLLFSKGEISGQDIANELGCTRSAVWKAVKQLRKEGYNIEGTTNKGYILVKNCVGYTAASVAALLNFEGDVELLDSVSSTNTELKKKAEAGEKEFKILIANKQTCGKGRRGRSFYSQNDGIFMSILLKPKLDAERSLYITTSAAVAVATAINEICGIDCKIKWVNDIFFNKKKICGILTEAVVDVETGCLDYAVLGIGINFVAQCEAFPEELQDIAGAVYSLRPSNYNEIKSRLVAAILNNFYRFYTNLESCEFMDKYRELCFIFGMEVTVIQANVSYKATVIDIDNNARLIVKTQNGIKVLSSGEVSLKIN
ncbi:MAG: biotin--[Clostridia bacterium]|nr:biotin--[acetyl-CoA-carboxylase] ligase [Clostridia bacterium]